MNNDWEAAGKNEEKFPAEEPAGTDTDTKFEADLSSALQPLALPPGFAERVLARAAAGQDAPMIERPGGGSTGARRVLAFPVQRQWMANSAIAAALLVGCFAGDVAYQRHRTEQRRATEATAQFEAAERVTDHALSLAREQVERAGVRLAD